MNSPFIKKWILGDFSWKRLLFSLVEIYVCLLIWAWFFSDRVIFQPPTPSSTPAPDSFTISVTSNKTLGLIYLPNTNSDFTVLYSHGNGEDLDQAYFLFALYNRAGFSILSYDYSGYGRSSGRPSTKQALQDAETVYQYAITELNIPESNLIVHGRSVGAAFAMHQAATFDPAGLIMESAFLTAFRARTRIPLAPFDKLRNNQLITQIRCPVLSIHGTDDNTIPFAQGQELHELVSTPKQHLWVNEAGHDDVLMVAGNSYWGTLRSFAATLPSAR